MLLFLLLVADAVVVVVVVDVVVTAAVVVVDVDVVVDVVVDKVVFAMFFKNVKIFRECSYDLARNAEILIRLVQMDLVFRTLLILSFAYLLSRKIYPNSEFVYLPLFIRNYW